MSHQPTCCLWEKVKADKTAVLSLCKDGALPALMVGRQWGCLRLQDRGAWQEDGPR